jgi:tubby-related protein 1
MNMNSTSNYHLFDMTRGVPGSKLTKKSANYMGKLRAQNSARTDYVVATSSLNKDEVAGIIFERQGVVSHLKNGSQPRKMIVVLPSLDEDDVPIPRARCSDDSILDELVSSRRPNDQDRKAFRKFHTKEPVFENGNYRLNFRGRVTTPSVKNFQLVPEEDIDDIICQFGKVGEDHFHLDYKSPLNAMQAFSLALAQFNL